MKSTKLFLGYHDYGPSHWGNEDTNPHDAGWFRRDPPVLKEADDWDPNIFSDTTIFLRIDPEFPELIRMSRIEFVHLKDLKGAQGALVLCPDDPA